MCVARDGLNIQYKYVPQHFKLQNHNYCLRTDIDKILPTKLKFTFLFKKIK